MNTHSDERVREAAICAEELVRTYIDLWNRGDIDAIWDRVYHRDASRLPWDKAGMKAARAKIKSEGFNHTDLLDLKTSPRSHDRVDVWIQFNRMANDGRSLPPGLRETVYDVQLSSDGWRIADMRSVV